MKKCIFTIVAKNYIGLGEILGSSIARFHDDVDFRIFVADEFDTQPSQLPDNVIVTRNLLGYSNDEWEDMAFFVRPYRILHGHKASLFPVCV